MFRKTTLLCSLIAISTAEAQNLQMPYAQAVASFQKLLQDHPQQKEMEGFRSIFNSGRAAFRVDFSEPDTRHSDQTKSGHTYAEVGFSKKTDGGLEPILILNYQVLTG